MDDNKQQILKLSKDSHSLTEKCYRERSAVKGDDSWLDKRKFLLADLSLHMVQAALEEDHPNPDLIKRYLFSILTICEDFIPGTDLRTTAEKLINKDIG